MNKGNLTEICAMTVLTVLAIACFPVNPLVLSGWLDVVSYLPLSIVGWIIWAIGMVLVMAPIVMFPHRGGVPKGKSFVHTTRLVDTGIYAVVRHPQYLGGVLAIFVATPLFYPHWLFVVLGIPGIVIIYFSTGSEEKRLIGQFGEDYREYARRVPRMNLVLGIGSFLKRRRRDKV